jgi:hypothetical protein
VNYLCADSTAIRNQATPTKYQKLYDNSDGTKDDTLQMYTYHLDRSGEGRPRDQPVHAVPACDISPNTWGPRKPYGPGAPLHSPACWPANCPGLVTLVWGFKT